MVKQYLSMRYKRIEAVRNCPVEIQNRTLDFLIHHGKNTIYGRRYNFDKINHAEDFGEAVPIVEYPEIKEEIFSMMSGNADILWPGKILWYSKSSGTTGDRSKYIPVSDDALYKNNVAASWDTMAVVYHDDPECKIFMKKNLIMGGALSPWPDNPQVFVGDISAILLRRMPKIGRPFYTPDFDSALLEDWEQKIDRIVRISSKEDVVMFAGVPTWTMVLFDRLLSYNKASNIKEVWPNVKYYFHGGVGFDPYFEQFEGYIPDPDFMYYEAYNASEGYFAIQDRACQRGMLLLLNNHIYYEFIPLKEYQTPNQKVYSIGEVIFGVDYVMVISTSAGLWRYVPGDVIRFSSIRPYRIEVVGRTKHYINVFGEEVMVNNTDRAIGMTCNEMGVIVADYTVGPVYLEQGSRGGHLWLIEFENLPEDMDAFAKKLDQNLQNLNSDYAAKRFKDMALVNLKIHVLPKGTFHRWLATKGKLGGQNKIPRLSNTLSFIDELLDIEKQLSN